MSLPDPPVIELLPVLPVNLMPLAVTAAALMLRLALPAAVTFSTAVSPAPKV